MLILSLAITMAGELSANEIKMAVVDIQAVALKMPQMQKIESTVKIEFAEQVNKVNVLRETAQYNYGLLQKKGDDKLSEEQIRETKLMVEFQQHTYTKEVKALQQKIISRKKELQDRALSKLNRVVETVAKKEGYDVAFRKGGVIFNSTSPVDITVKVITAIQNSRN